MDGMVWQLTRDEEERWSNHQIEWMEWVYQLARDKEEMSSNQKIMNGMV